MSETPVDIKTDLDDVVVTFSDRGDTISGTVQSAEGQSTPETMVLLFPVDPAAWVDFGRTSRRVRSASTSSGRFSFPAPPAGDYLLIAVPDEQAGDWQSRDFLSRAAPLADRATVVDGQSLTHVLRARRLSP